MGLLVAEQELAEERGMDEVENGVDEGQVEDGLFPFGFCHLNLFT